MLMKYWCVDFHCLLDFGGYSNQRRMILFVIILFLNLRITYITYSCLIILNGSKRCVPRYKKDIAMLMESMIHFLALHLFISCKDSIWVANSTVSDERKMHSIPPAVYEAAVHHMICVGAL